MKEKGLVRNPKERDIDFALRVLEHIQKTSTYKIHSSEFMETRMKELSMNRLGVLYGKISRVLGPFANFYEYAGARMVSPCRQVSGFMLKKQVPSREGGHHRSGEVYTRRDRLGAGRILMGSTNNKKASFLFKFLGHGK